MKKSFLAACAVFLGLLSPLASACGDMCVQPIGYESKFTVGGNANFGGFGGGMFLGQEGFVRAEKAGHSNVDVKMEVAGELCGIDCKKGKFSAVLEAGEWVKVSSGAFGTKSGETVTTSNGGGSFANATFQFSGKK